MTEYVLVKCANDEMFIGELIDVLKNSIILNNPLKMFLFRNSLQEQAKCLVSEWNELSNETTLELNSNQILYATIPNEEAINYYLSSLRHFNEPPIVTTDKKVTLH